jgi:hypothetical protein
MTINYHDALIKSLGDHREAAYYLAAVLDNGNPDELELAVVRKNHGSPCGI